MRTKDPSPNQTIVIEKNAPKPLTRPRNGAQSGDGLRIDRTSGRDAGRMVDRPFAPAETPE